MTTISTGCAASSPSAGTTGVSGTNKEGAPGAGYAVPPADPTVPQLMAARPLVLSLVPATPEAFVLVDKLTALVTEEEAPGRVRQRGTAGQADLRAAVGAIVGGVLYQWSGDTPRLASCAQSAASFTDANVTRRAFKAARDGLQGLGLLAIKDGVRLPPQGKDDFEGWKGLVARFWPTGSLLQMAQDRGVTRETARRAFRPHVPKTPPKIKAPVVMKDFKERRGAHAMPARRMALQDCDHLLAVAAAEVEAHNAFAASVSVEGCVPPRWHRSFTASPYLGGRWYAAGGDAETNHQRMKPQARQERIRIAGEAVVEVDVSAAHMTILHGLQGLPLPSGDLYGGVLDLGPGDLPEMIERVPRAAVKAWVGQTLGRGKPSRRWARGTPAEHQRHRAASIMAAMVARFPFLSDLCAVLPAYMERDHLERHQTVALFLQAVEAEALTTAMRRLRAAGVLALPMHDGLIVPASAEVLAADALLDGYRAVVGVTPRVATKVLE